MLSTFCVPLEVLWNAYLFARVKSSIDRSSLFCCSFVRVLFSFSIHILAKYSENLRVAGFKSGRFFRVHTNRFFLFIIYWIGIHIQYVTAITSHSPASIVHPCSSTCLSDSFSILLFRLFVYKLQTLWDLKKESGRQRLKEEENPIVSLDFERISLHRFVYRTCLSVCVHRNSISNYCSVQHTLRTL